MLTGDQVANAIGELTDEYFDTLDSDEDPEKDPAYFHRALLGIWQPVLQAIADGACVDPRDCARVALDRIYFSSGLREHLGITPWHTL